MQKGDITSPPTGAYLELADLIALRFPARQLQLSRRTRALSVLVGPNKANFRGRGIDFEEVRNYQPGDDIRTIDWRVTARTGTAHTKVFREERERPVLVVTDQRESLFFGSQNCFKSVLAAHCASLLAWSALANGDRVGGVIFNDSDHREIRPRRARKTVLAMLSQLEHYNRRLPLQANLPVDSFSRILENLRRIARPGSSVYLISDFHGADDEAAMEHLFQLAQHTEITAVVCRDKLEQELPRAGVYAVTDGAQRTELVTSDRGIRTRYQQHARQRADNLAANMQRLGIPLLTLTTEQAPFSVLQQYYGDSRR